MKRFMAIIVCAALVLTASSFTAFASDVDGTDVFSVSIDNDANPQTVTVSGQTDGAYRVVTLMVLQMDLEVSDISGLTSGSVLPQILHFRETLSGIDGSFSFPAFPQTTNSGTFLARIAVEDHNTTYALTYRFFNILEIDDFLVNSRTIANSAANAATRATELRDEIAARGERLDFDERFDALSSDNQLAVARILLADHARAPIFNTPGDFSAAFDRAYAVQNFNMNTAGGNITALFDRFSDVIDRTAIPAYLTYTNSNVISPATRTLIYNAMANRSNYVFVEDVLDFFTERVVLLGTLRADNVLQLRLLLEVNQAAIGINFNSLSSASNFNNVLAAVVNRQFSNLTALRTAILSAANNQNNNNNNNNNNNTGSNMGGPPGTHTAPPNLLGPGNEPPPPADNVDSVFPDVSDLLWAVAAVNGLYERGVISGRPDGTFDPDNTITREEFTKMIVHAAGLQSSYEPTGFNDISSSSWAYGYVSAAVQAGLINGVGYGYFGYGQNITREDMAVIMYRVAVNRGMEIQPTEHVFNDNNLISEHAESGVSAAFSLGLIQGVGGNMFAPRGNATRAQAAVIVYRFLQRVGV